MSEAAAWLDQAESDLVAAGRVYVRGEHGTYCQAAAKCQQTLEKGVKALAAALNERGLTTVPIGYRHTVDELLSVLRKLPGRPDTGVVAAIRSALTPGLLSKIRSLETVVPRRPPPGEEPRRNTEYPFRRNGAWMAPAQAGSFTVDEVEDFIAAARQLARLRGAISVVRKLPR